MLLKIKRSVLNDTPSFIYLLCKQLPVLKDGIAVRWFLFGIENKQCRPSKLVQTCIRFNRFHHEPLLWRARPVRPGGWGGFIIQCAAIFFAKNTPCFGQ